MEEHLTILPPPPPAWTWIRAAAWTMLGRAAAAIVRAVSSAARRRPAPETTFAALLDRIDGERACREVAPSVVAAAAIRASLWDRPTRVEVRRPGAI